MFHPNRISIKLDIFRKDLLLEDPKHEIFPEDFQIARHTIEAVDQANKHLSIIEGRSLNIDEIRWIRNERAICRADFLYWATRYAYIKDTTGELIHFSPNLPQKLILGVMAEMEDEQIAIILQIHKARQEGVTTLAELIMLWRTIFTPGANTLVSSSRPDKTPEMVGKMDIAYSNLPIWLVPKIGTRNANKIGFDAQDSYIHLRHGAMMSDMGRGDTFTSFHLSEVSEYVNPKEAIDAALLRAVHDSPWLLGIFESTGSGRSGWWFEKWEYNSQYWPLRESRMCPIFLPWYILRELYPTKTWLRAHPIKPDYIPTDRAAAHAKKAEEYVRSGINQIVTRELGDKWSMPIEQVWFWELSRREAEAGKTLHLFYQELCATPEDGFQSPNAGLFDAEIIHTMRDETPQPYGVYGIRCSQAEIPRIHQVRDIDIDTSQKPIEIKAQWLHSQPSHNYTLYPLLHRGSAPFSPHGKIIMYEPPRTNKEYGQGVDTGYGIGKDRSVCEIIRKGDQFERDEQVCEFASPQMNSFQLWPITLALGTLYSTRVGGDLKQCKVIIEGAANGENVYNELKKRGWRNFHNWVRYNKKQLIEANANQQLWYTNAWSRPLMLDMLFDAVTSGWLKINSPWFVDELGTLEILEVKQKIAAAVNEHDDRIMAVGITLFSLHAMETKHNDMWRARIQQDQVDPEEFARYSVGSQGSAPDPDDPINPYTYTVVGPKDFRYEDLAKPGASLWIPGKD